MGGLDQGEARSAFHRHERQVVGQVTHPADLGVTTADADLGTGAVGPEPVQVGMPAARDHPTPTTRATGSLGRFRRGAQQARGEVERERRLADAARTGEQDGVWRAARAQDHRPDRREGGGVSPSPSPIHVRQAGSAAAGLRVEARFGLASTVGASASAVALAAAGLRVEARFGLAAGASASVSAAI